jgi:amino acid adenylation domain-containing protein
MMRHFQILLEAAVVDPEMRCSQLPLLSTEELRQVLIDWNATQAEYPGELCVHDLIAQQAHQSPDRVAIVCGARTMSYRDLHQRSNQLARYLQKHGVGPGVLVGLMVDRSPDLLVALLGIMKAGGAYVPLDPAYPKDRIHLILEDSAAPVILTDQALADTLLDSAAETIYLDTLWPAIAHECADDLPCSVGPGNLAYVLYTSGSTGKPKGVQIEHRSVVNFLISMQRQPGLAADDVLLAVTTISFDIAGLELFLPLVTGAKVALASREQAADPVQLQALLASSQATVMQATPATWRMMLESGWTGNPGLKVLCGGESLPPDLSNQLVPRCNELWNMYGPTETTIWSSVYRVDSELAQTAPIGRPISNTTMYVLDSRGEPVPTGVLGELYIGGAGLARGYQNLPDFTAERFVASPFEPGKRLYRTGDLASYLPDGNLRFHGRADFQVKIRGFRIELGEIETVLAKHASVERVVVAVRESRPGEQMLVAYIVPKPEQDVVPAELRAHLEQSLPGYMSPAAFVKLDELPLTDNGKINRRALPAPEWSRLETVSKTAPRDQLELILVRIWQRVLHLSSVGVDDNFFDLGGHSLLAVRLLSEVEKVVGWKIPLAILFRGSTVASLAKLLREGSESDPEPLVVEFQASRGDAAPLFAVAEPGVRSLGYALLARHLGEDQPFYKLQAQGIRIKDRPLNLQELRSLARQYVAGTRAVQPQGPYLITAMCGGCQIAEQMILQLEEQGQEVALFAIFDTWVNENVHRRWRWRLFNFHQRGRWLRTVSFREQVRWIMRALDNRIRLWSGKDKASQPWAEAYWPQDFKPPRFHAPVVLFKRPKQPYFYIDDPTLGWGARSQGGVEMHNLNADHHEVLREPHLQIVSKVLLARLRSSSAGALEPAINKAAANPVAAMPS